MNYKTKRNLYIAGIMIVGALDAFTATITGILPAWIGALITGVSNAVWEIIQLALVFGLLKAK